MHEIDLNGVERKICRECVDNFRMGGKPEKPKMVQHSTMYRTDELEEDKEEAEGTVHLNGGDKVNIVPFVYPRGTVSVSSLGSFLSVGSSSKPLHLPLEILLNAVCSERERQRRMGRFRRRTNRRKRT